MVTREQAEFFHANGFLRLEQVYSCDEVAAMTQELEYVMDTFANWDAAWRGPWRGEYAPGAEDKVSLVSIESLDHYSAAWARATLNPKLADALGTLLGNDVVELHHMTLHAKSPDAGAPFPMHQDYVFYPHEDGRYIDALAHVDDADETSGCIKFLAGSHKLGPLPHIIGSDWRQLTDAMTTTSVLGPLAQVIEGDSTPHLPTDQYRLEDAVAVPAKAGDVVLFHLWTVHGSALNNSGRWRRLVRMGYRDPSNRQIGGLGMGRPGVIVRGVRPKVEGVEIDVYGNWVPRK